MKRDHIIKFMRWFKDQPDNLTAVFSELADRYLSKDKSKPPEIICMCGSTRFSDLMAAISWEMEKQSKIVLRVNYLPGWYVKNAGWTQPAHGAEQDGLKEVLDTLHCRKIDLCDRVFVCNVDGYIGESTRNEINYATKIGKPIVYIHSHERNEFSDMTDQLQGWWRDQHTPASL